MKTSTFLSVPLLVLLLLLRLSISLVASDSVSYDTFLKCLQNHTDPSDQISSILYTKTNPSYTTVLQSYIRNRRYNLSSTPKPAIIVTPTHESHVSAAVICSNTIGMQLKIRSGGHDFEGISYWSNAVPFVVLDMFNLWSVTVDIEQETAWVQAGATLGELYYGILKKSKVLGFPAGVCTTVGVGGHISGGGYGNMMRKYGLSIDHVIDAQIVDASGSVLDRKSMGEDLFWAIRGGGGASFGVILSYTLKLVRVPETVTVFRMEKTLEQNATDIVYRWQNVAYKIDHDLFMRMHLNPVGSTIRASFESLFLGDCDRLVSITDKDFPELGLTKEHCLEMSWGESLLYWSNFQNWTSFDALLDRNQNSASFQKRKSDYVQTPICKDGLEWIWKKMIQVGKTGLVFNPYGGRMSEIPATETAFPHRAGNLFKIEYLMNWHEEGSEADKLHMNQIRRIYGHMTPFVTKSPRAAYLNYRDLDIGINHHDRNSYKEGKVYGEKYFLGNFDRLVEVKTMVDPHNFFRNEQSIPTLPS